MTRFCTGHLALLVSLALLLVLVGPVQALPIAQPGVSQKPVSSQSPAERLVTQGFDAMLKGDLNSAEAAFNGALKQDPRQTGAMLGLAEVSLRRKRPAEAEAQLKRALAAQPEGAEVHAAYGRYYFSQGQHARAEAAYKKAIALDSGVFLAHMDLGELYLNVMRKPQEAAAAYRKAVALQSSYAPARFGLGMALLASGKKPEAITELQQAARLAPKDPAAPHVIGRIHASEKRFDEAAQSLTSALQAKSDFLPALSDRADIYAEMQKNSEAAADYEQILRVRPKDSVIRLKLGMIYQRLNRLRDAESTYHAALKENPDLAPAYNNLAMIALNSDGKSSNALSWAQKAVELAPKVPQFHDTLGWVHRARGDKVKAVAALEEATRLPPPQADIWYRLGVVYEEAGKKGEALAAYKKALAIQANFSKSAEAKARIVALGK